MEEKMRISKEVMSGALEIFDKHFPTEKNTPLKDKKKIVKFFINFSFFSLFVILYLQFIIFISI